MKIFVTVGTTPFNSLIEKISQVAKLEWDVTAQTAVEGLTYSNIQCFAFTDNINQFVKDADLVVSHAGAGSVYSLLEQNRKLLVIPNLVRQDKHQSDLARFIQREAYAKSCFDLEQLRQEIEAMEDFTPLPYKKVDFFKGQEILDLIQSSLIPN